MEVPEGHPLGADLVAFFAGVRSQINHKLGEEIKDLNGVKFQLVLKVQLMNENPDGVVKYSEPHTTTQAGGNSASM